MGEGTERAKLRRARCQVCAALAAARVILRYPDDKLSVRRLRNGVTVIRFDDGEGYFEVGLEREPLALLTDDERARIDRLAGASDG